MEYPIAGRNARAEFRNCVAGGGRKGKAEEIDWANRAAAGASTAQVGVAFRPMLFVAKGWREACYHPVTDCSAAERKGDHPSGDLPALWENNFE